MDLLDRSALSLREALEKREIGAVELAQEALGRIAQWDGAVKSTITVLPDAALEQARAAQKKLDAGQGGPLCGIPMALKDNLSTAGIPTTCASRMLERYIPAYNATAVARLADAGAVLLAKLNMDEFAMGSTSETSYFGAVKNPWDLSRVPGGSSGGAAAAVAAGFAAFALGSDTGGSIRQPCGYCGVTGLKPTYGRVSRYGLLAYASSLDQIGPVGRDARDCAAVLEAIAGEDAHDGTCAKVSLSNTTWSPDALRGKCIGLPRQAFGDGLQADVRARVQEAARQMENIGAKLIEVDLPELDYGIAAYYIIACAEASSNLSRYDGVQYGYRPDNVDDLASLYLRARSEGFGLEVQRRMMLGAFTLSSGYYDAYYLKAQKARARVAQGFARAFEQCDLLLSPTAPATAPRLGQSLDDPLKMYLSDLHTVSVNLAGLPALALPCGLAKEGLPVGFQLIGPAFSEGLLLTAGDVFQQATGHHLLRPEAYRGGVAV